MINADIRENGRKNHIYFAKHLTQALIWCIISEENEEDIREINR